MKKLVKFGLIPALIVLSVAAIVLNVCYPLIKKPAMGKVITIEKLQPQPKKIR